MSLPSPSERQDRRKANLFVALVVTAALALVAAASVLAWVETRESDTAAKPRWTWSPPMPHRRSYTAAAEIGGQIYVAAGMVGNSGRPLDLFERFDPATDEWSSLRSVPKAFSAAAGAALGGQMYVVGGNVVGGSSPDTSGHQVYAYDVRRGRWRSVTPLPAPRTNHSAIALAGKLYAIGGLDPLQPTRTVFVYDPRTTRWSEAAPLPEELHALTATVFRGEIWALGGRLRNQAISRRVWIYNAKQNRWRAGPTMPRPMELLGADTVDGRIHAVLESTYLIYDGRTSRWSQGPRPRVPRHALALFDVRGRLYAIGGCTVPQLEDSPVVESIASR